LRGRGLTLFFHSFYDRPLEFAILHTPPACGGLILFSSFSANYQG